MDSKRRRHIPPPGQGGTNDSPTFIQDTSYVQLGNERDRRYTDRFQSERDLMDERDRRYGAAYDRLAELGTNFFTQIRDSAREVDVRQQQRFDASQQALRDALTTQKEAVNAALAAAEKAVNAALAASDKALTLAQEIGEKWREDSNEWRGAMDDREKEFVPRTEVAQQFKGTEDKLAVLLTAMNQTQGRGDNEQIKALTSAVATLTASMHEGTGRYQNREQSAAGMASVVFALVGLAGIAVTVIIAIVK